MRYSILALLVLAGCAQQMADSPALVPAPGPDTCGAAAYAALIGQDAPSALIVPQPKRVYRIGDPVTMDLVADRINIQLNDRDVISAITCG